MTPSKNRILKCACYTTCIGQSVVANISPMLFLTFRDIYGISYSLLGMMVLINFATQLLVDLIFSFFSHKFNITATVRMIPVLTVVGLVLYAVWPFFFPDSVYAGLVAGTVIFSASGGLNEVLISPVIAAIPAEDPDREMSKLHSTYAWGVVGIIIFTTLFLWLFGSASWQWLVLILSVIPFLSIFMFAASDIPKMETPEKVTGAFRLLKNKGVWLCFTAIFLGGASELTMGQWSSGYLEQALGIEKIWGDIFGVAFFSFMLGLGRTMYSKIGKNIEKILFLGAVGATVCYFVAAVSDIAIVGLLACSFTGFCVSMMWPGSLIVGSERFPQGGVFIYALMAAGGDMGASVAPQLVGIITDAVISNPAFASLASSLSLTSEQLGMKLGMLVGMLFPLIAVFVYLRIWNSKKKPKKDLLV